MSEVLPASIQMARLNMTAPDMFLVLKEIEWIETVDPDGDFGEINWVCPSCWARHEDYTAPEARGHARFCKLAAALAKAEGRG